MNYRADIDALRAVAVLSVILFHLGVPGFSGGFVGVDIFFVISGYVIAKSLEDDLIERRFSVWRFYNKRIRRIFPALFTALLATWIAAYFLLLPNYFEDFSKTLTASSAFAANIYFWKTQNYFSPEAITRPLNHIWSLSLEEQYYIFAPLLTFVVFRYLRRQWCLVLLAILLFSLSCSVFLLPKDPVGDFFLLPTRAWEFLMGALLAHASLRQVRAGWIKDGLGVIGLSLITYATSTFTKTTFFPGANALIPCLGAAILIYIGQTDMLGFITRALSIKPLSFTGKISYSLYLIHWPLIVFSYFVFLHPPQGMEIAGIILFGFILSIFSWRYIEQPFRQPKAGLYPVRVFIAALIFISALCALGYAGTKYKGWPSRMPDYHYAYGQAYGAWRMEVCYFNIKADPVGWTPEKCTLTNPGQRKALLWGDSLAAHYAPGIVQYKSKIPYTVIQYTAGKCPPILSYASVESPGCDQFNAHALDIIKEEKIDTVVLAARWADTDPEQLIKLGATIATLEKMNLQIYVIGQSPKFMMDPQVIAYYKNKLKIPPPNLAEIDLDPRINADLAVMSGKNTFINPIAAFCKGNFCPLHDFMGENIYLDQQHYTLQGSRDAVKAYFPLLSPTLAIPSHPQ